MHTLDHAGAIAPTRLRRPVWPLPYVAAPTLRVALPNGKQLQLPGTLWPDLDAWTASADRSVPAPIEILVLTRKQANVHVGAWHDLGPETRCFGYAAFAMVVFGEVLAVATSGSTMSASVDQTLGLSRRNTIELTRLCRSPQEKARGTLRAMLRLYRDFLATGYPPKNRCAEPTRALVTYSMPGRCGDLYRFDSWFRVRGCKPWGGGATWSGPSRVDGLGADKALWVYPIPGTGDAARAVLERRRRAQRLAAKPPA